VIHPLSRTACAGAALLPLVGLALALPLPSHAQSLFATSELDQSKFVLVSAPIGDGSRAQLNIYEQRSAVRPCFALEGANPAVVNPLLATFDFTGICNRYIDANGYSVRVGGTDLATVYRLSVVRQPGENQLLAIPTKAGAGPEMVVARTGGSGSGFLLLVPEPGWKLMRRSFGGRPLGHVYLYREAWPEGAGSPAATSSSSAPATPLAPAARTTVVAPASAPAAAGSSPPVAPPLALPPSAPRPRR
jgi:hypothetical protein